MNDKTEYTEKELEAIRLDLSERVSFLQTNDDQVNKQLELLGKFTFELMKFAKIGLPYESALGNRIVDNLEASFLLMREGVYRMTMKRETPPEKVEPSRIVRP